MYFTDDSLLPENQDPLIITAAPYGPVWMPADYPEDIPVSWEAQAQKAVDCYNAGATVLHIHVRDPKTGHISKNFKEYGDLIGRLREAVPKMVLQVGGSISFAPEGNEKAKWQSYDTRHMLAEIDPKPDQVTVAIGTSLYDMTPLTTMDDVQGTHLANPEQIWAFSQMVADAAPDFYIEHLKRLKKTGIPTLLRALSCPLTHDRGASRPPRHAHGAGERFLQHGRRRRDRHQSVRLDGVVPPDAAWLGVHVSDDVALQLAARERVHCSRAAHPRRHRGEPLGHDQGEADDFRSND